MAILNFTTLVLSSIALLALYILPSKYRHHVVARKFAEEHGCRPPVLLPQSENIIGASTFLKFYRAHAAHKILDTFNDLHCTHGSTFTMRMLSKDIIFTTDPENIKALLATRFEDFGIAPIREKGFKPLFGSSIFTTDGEAWQHSRALVRPAFTRTQLADVGFFEPHIEQLMRRIPPDGSTVDLAPLFSRLTLDTAMEFLLGDDLDPLQPQKSIKRQEFGTNFDYAQSKLGSLKAKGWLRYMPWNRKFFQSCKAVHDFVDEFVATAQAEQAEQNSEKPSQEKSERYVFIHELAESTNDSERIRDELLSILLAGRDTTAGLLTNTFHLLARHPKVWAKLRNEVQPLYGLPPSYEELKSFKYLKQVIDESQRLYPVVPQNGRVALKDTYLPHGGGPDGLSPIFIPADQAVGYSVYAMQRNPQIYGDDATEFKPERWDTMRQGWHYLPFNGGPRVCPGQQYALTEAMYVIVRLLQRFGQLENRDPEPWIEMLSLTAVSRNGVKVGLIA